MGSSLLTDRSVYRRAVPMTERNRDDHSGLSPSCQGAERLCEPARHLGDAMDEVADQQLGGAELEAGNSKEQLPEDGPELAAGQGGAHAEVGAAATEADVFV